jgi:hypothetical protein
MPISILGAFLGVKNMEMAITKLETSTAIGVALLKQAQEVGSEQALALLENIPQAPSVSGMGARIDISV